MGPDQHAQLDGFSLFLPFPYRVAVILVAGMRFFLAGFLCFFSHVDLCDG